MHLVEVDGVAHRVSRDEGGVVRSPAPALVIATLVEAGAEVEAGAPVLVLESMKMETVLRAPFKARLKECLVTVGSQIESGSPLLRLEPLAEDEAEDAETAEQVELDLPAVPKEIPARDRAQRGLEDLRSLLLGFDVDPHDEGRVLEDYLAARQAATADGHRFLTAELCLLNVFSDLAELSRNRPPAEEVSGESHVHSAREYFHTYLQSLEVERAGLPETFQAKLAKRSATTASMTWSAPQSWKLRCSGSFWPSSGRPVTPMSSLPCCGPGCANRRRTPRYANPSTWPWNAWWPPPSCASQWYPT